MAWTDPSTNVWTVGHIVTNAELQAQVIANMQQLWHEVAYTEFTSSVSANSVSEGSATTVVSAGAVTLAAYPICIEFYCPTLTVSTSASNCGLNLWDDAGSGAADKGRIFQSVSTAMAVGDYPCGILARRLTPTATTHTYSVRIWNNTAVNFTAQAGAGGASTLMPGYIRIWQKGGA